MVVRASKEKATSLLDEQHSAGRHLADENEIKSDLSTPLSVEGSFVKAFWCLMSVLQMPFSQMTVGQMPTGQIIVSQILVGQIPVIRDAC